MKKMVIWAKMDKQTFFKPFLKGVRLKQNVFIICLKEKLKQVVFLVTRSKTHFAQLPENKLIFRVPMIFLKEKTLPRMRCQIRSFLESDK